MNVASYPIPTFRQRPPSSDIPGSQPFLHLDTYHTTRSSARAVDAVRNNLRKALEQDPGFFSKFFPIDSRIRRIYEEYQNQFRYRNRWSGIPSKPKAVSRLYTPLNNLLNNILQIFGLYEDARRFVTT